MGKKSKNTPADNPSPPPIPEKEERGVKGGKRD